MVSHSYKHMNFVVLCFRDFRGFRDFRDFRVFFRDFRVVFLQKKEFTFFTFFHGLSAVSHVQRHAFSRDIFSETCHLKWHHRIFVKIIFQP